VHLQRGNQITESFKLGSDTEWERVKRNSAYTV